MPNETQLSGSPARVPISDGGYELYAPGLTGVVREVDQQDVATR